MNIQLLLTPTIPALLGLIGTFLLMRRGLKTDRGVQAQARHNQAWDEMKELNERLIAENDRLNGRHRSCEEEREEFRQMIAKLRQDHEAAGVRYNARINDLEADNRRLKTGIRSIGSHMRRNEPRFEGDGNGDRTD